MKTTINQIPNGLKAGGPYSIGVVTQGRLLYVSGQGPWDPKTGKFERGTIAQQTELTLNNVKAVVEAAGGKMENAVSCRVFLQPLDTTTFQQMNAVYQKYFGPNPPTRTTVGCQLLGIDVEIDCVVSLDAK